MRRYTYEITITDDLDDEDVRERFRDLRRAVAADRGREIARADERARARGPIMGVVSAADALRAGTLLPRTLHKLGLLKPLRPEGSE